MRYFLDEQQPGALAEGLRRAQIEAVMCRDTGRVGLTDESHLEWARAARWLIFTHDSDFARLHQSGVPHAGIVFCEERKYSIGARLRALVALAEAETMESMAGRLHFL